MNSLVWTYPDRGKKLAVKTMAYARTTLTMVRNVAQVDAGADRNPAYRHDQYSNLADARMNEQHLVEHCLVDELRVRRHVDERPRE